jgi:putative pyruvate formate lyase activating enzyme
MTSFEPAYLQLLRTSPAGLAQRVQDASRRLASCNLCAQECHVDRRTEKGVCRTGMLAVVSSYGPHHGEEAPLSGRHGSGAIFFSRCNMRCQFCQNYDISQLGDALTEAGGHAVGPQDLAAMMLELQAMGCHNINLVSPSHVVAQILAAAAMAAEDGLRLPLVYNTGGYDSLAALRLLDGVIDIYMPDMKYADAKLALRLSKVRNYTEVNRAAVQEMHRQVGDLLLDGRGLAQRGLLVRHLVMPAGLAGTPDVARFLADEISRDTYLNVMAQYHPAYKAHEHPPLDRRITPQEYADAVAACRAAGLYRFDR